MNLLPVTTQIVYSRRKALNRTLEIADRLQMKKELKEAKEAVGKSLEIGEKRGRELGEKAGKEKVIKNLHNLNIPIEQIAKAVELTEEEVEKILKIHN